MSIRLDRKKILCISFFLCCVLPACLSWFQAVEESFSGLSQLELPLLIGTTLFAFALLFERPHFILPFGILSHLLLLGFSMYAFFTFPVSAGFVSKPAISVSLDAASAGFWVGIALQLAHLALFSTTELAVRKLARHRAANDQAH